MTLVDTSLLGDPLRCRFEATTWWQATDALRRGARVPDALPGLPGPQPVSAHARELPIPVLMLMSARAEHPQGVAR
jgi:hypothetical protein